MPNLLFTAAKEIQEYIHAQEWDFCFIGGLAVLRWGEMRMTQDVDLRLQANNLLEQRMALTQNFYLKNSGKQENGSS